VNNDDDLQKFSVWFWFYQIYCDFIFPLRFFAVYHLMCVHSTVYQHHLLLEMTYFHAVLVQLIVSRSDSELEVQSYGMKKNTFESLTVDPIMLEDKL